MKEQKFIQAPLPFQGQKRMFLAAFKQALGYFSPTATYVDLFGGSGLLSYTTKQHYPQAKVIYNDYDNYVQRLRNIDKTNALLADIRQIVIKSPTYRKSEKLEEKYKKQVLKRIEQERGFVDYITLSANITFSGQFFDNWDELKNQHIYICRFFRSGDPNYIKQYDNDINSYLNGLEIVRSDAYALYKKYNLHKNVVFIIDPPYLNTDQQAYKNKGWNLREYLDIIHYLQSSRYIYFTSNKSQIRELCAWMAKETDFKNPFVGAYMVRKERSLNHNSSYLDIMIFKNKK